ncbi:MAG: helix-turn-helix transcriptional regulator [Desulfitobacterium hafniense]|nr:helix-turn-helix transcriptional regulator [Desulfitobacterium hafniense]
MTVKQVVYKQSKVKQARLLARIATQKELAQLTGISPNIISDLERSYRKMTPSWAMRIAEVVGTEWTTLLEEESE